MQRVRERRPQEFDRVLSSMCTEPHPRAHEAAVEFLATNPGDPETYRTVAELEREAVDDPRARSPASMSPTATLPAAAPRPTFRPSTPRATGLSTPTTPR